MTKLFCCGCQRNVYPRLTNGAEIYPHRKDLKSLPFWKCDACSNYVGCHHKTSQPTRPLGLIPTAAIRTERNNIHSVLDPLWKSGKFTRKEVYNKLSGVIGYPFHTAEIKSVDEAKGIYTTILRIFS